jgi:hypothetical protein
VGEQEDSKGISRGIESGVIKMKDFDSSQVKFDFAMFMSKETGQLEFWHNKFSREKIKPWKLNTESLPGIKLEPIKSFDFRDLVKESKLRPDDRPSQNDVIKSWNRN